MIYLDILVNDNDDCLLYVNGRAYNDISEYWVDCIKFLGELLDDRIQVKISRTSKERKDFPEILTWYTNAEQVWKKIDIDSLQYFLSKRTVKWEYEDDVIIINHKDAIPNNIKFDCLLKGQWYVLIIE